MPDDLFLEPITDDSVDMLVDDLLGDALADEQTLFRLAALGLLADDPDAARVVLAVITEAQGVDPAVIFDELPPDLTDTTTARTPAAIAAAARHLARGGR